MTKEEKGISKDAEFSKHFLTVFSSVIHAFKTLPKDVKAKIEESIDECLVTCSPYSLTYFANTLKRWQTKDIVENEKKETETTEDKTITTLADFINEKNEKCIKLGTPRGGNYEPSDIKAYRTLALILIDKDCWCDGWKRDADSMVLILSEKGTQMMRECVEILGSESLESNPFIIDPVISSRTYIQIKGFYKTNMKIVLGRRNISIDTEKELQFIIDRLCMLGNTSKEQIVDSINDLKSRFNSF